MPSSNTTASDTGLTPDALLEIGVQVASSATPASIAALFEAARKLRRWLAQVCEIVCAYVHMAGTAAREPFWWESHCRAVLVLVHA